MGNLVRRGSLVNKFMNKLICRIVNKIIYKLMDKVIYSLMIKGSFLSSQIVSKSVELPLNYFLNS